MVMNSFKRIFQRWMTAAILFTIFFAGIGCGRTPADQGGPTETPLPTPVVPTKPTYDVKLGNVIKEYEFSGKIAPVVSNELTFKENGFIGEINVEKGDRVKKDQVLATLESKDLENQLAQAKLSLTTSETQMQAAQQNIDDQLTEAKINLVIEQLKLDQAKYGLKQDGGPDRQYQVQIQEQLVKLAQLHVDTLERGVDPQLVQSVEAAKLMVKRLEDQLASNKIVSPIDGMVTDIYIYRPGDSVTAYRPAIVVADPSSLEISADLGSDANAAQLVVGMPVEISLGNTPGKNPLKGTVRRVPSNSPNEVDKTTRISLEIPPESSGLSLDDFMRVKVILAEKDNVLWLPPQAIRIFEGRRFVVVQDDKGLRRVDVKTGLSGTDQIEIVDGLTEGQIVQAP